MSLLPRRPRQAIARVALALAASLALALPPTWAHAKPPLPPPRPASELQYVRSFEDFKTLMELHVSRLEPMAMEILSLPELREEFRDVDPELMRQQIRLHDLEKFENFKDPESFLRQLYAYYGYDVHLPPRFRKDPSVRFRHFMTTPQRAYGQDLIKRLNERGAQIQKEFFRAHGLLTASGELTPVARKMQLLEKVVDLVDRALSKVTPEEMGGWPAELVSTWIYGDLEKKIARHFEAAGERNYRKLTGHLAYENRHVLGCSGNALRALAPSP